MAYHIFSYASQSSNDLAFDRYLGSAVSVEFYWESVGRELKLPIISSLTERADSEEGFSISSSDLVRFKNELTALEIYWKEKSLTMELPNDFLQGIRSIATAIDVAIADGLTVMIA